MPLWLDIDSHNGIPIYVQIVEQVKHALRVGILANGDHLPTVRQLAQELSIAPNTIMKAYNELQHLGLITSRAGVGTIVTVSEAMATTLRYETIRERLQELVRDAVVSGVALNELEQMLREAIEQHSIDGN